MDYGTKRIGLAVSDPFRNFAQPVGTFPPQKITEAIQTIRRRDGVEKIVVGHPLNSDGSENRMTAVVDRFVEELRKTFPDLAIETLDEHGSTKEAQKVLVASGRSRRERREKGRLDAAAACLLLQNYLDSPR
ncbi:Holliday junction resolvase RuvX [Prosthecochloris sp. GSB1]|nr:Holliday junction resolvase RuvX [Prosthecochloris sp. GSB1]